MSEKNMQSPYKKIMVFLEFFLAKPFSLLPLNNSIIFESHSDFCDNSKALFDKVIENNINEKYKIYWLVEDIDKFRNKNITNVKFVSIKRDTILEKVISELKNVFLFSQCKYYFYSHRNFARTKPKKGQNFINLTHGMSLKNSTKVQTVELDKISYIAVTSKFSATLRARTYQGGESKTRIFGFPRNDLLLSKNDTLNKLYNINEYNFKKIIVWMPTFRRQKNSSRNDTGTQKDTDLPILKDKLDLSRLNQFLLNNDVLLIVKPHPAQDLKFFNQISTSNVKVLTNKKLIEKGIELYELLSQSDALITDYSSVYIDYLLTDKPIGFTIDDLKDYDANLGFLVDNPLEYMPGPKIETVEDIMEFICNIAAEKDDYQKQRQNIRGLFHKYDDNNSSERILEYFKLIEE